MSVGFGKSRVGGGVRDPQQWLLWLSGLVGARYDGLRHFHVVERGVLMRCGQPRVGDLAWVREEHGLGTVVCARGGTRHPLRGRWFGKERGYCEREGIRFVHWSFSDSGPPPPVIFDEFLSLMRDPSHYPVLVHCEQGFHRTGILCAAYRLGLQGWDMEAALEEMKALGFEHTRRKRAPLVNALRSWARDLRPGEVVAPGVLRG